MATQFIGLIDHVQKSIAMCLTSNEERVTPIEEQNSDTFLINVYPEWENIEQSIETKEIAFGNITSLSLINCNLYYFPNAFKTCKSLVELDISYNNFNHVPDMVLYSNCTVALKMLNMSNNIISNFSIAPKSCLTLEYLDLSNNKLSEIPAWILNADCYKLTTLNLSVNCIEKMEPMNGRSFRKLTNLLLNNSQTKGNILNFIYKQPNLQKLSLSNTTTNFFNTIHHFNFNDLVCGSVLTELQFSNLGYSEIPEEITLLKSLQILNLSENCISWLPTNFEQMKSLQILNLSYNEMFELPENIGELSNLKELYLSFNILGSLPESILNIENLEIIDCYHNDMLIDSIVRIFKMPSVIATDFEQNSFETSDIVLNNYEEKREKLRILWKNDRSNGKNSDDEEYCWEESKLKDEDYYSDTSENKTNINEEFSFNKIEEENWNCDEDTIYNDDFLTLPHYRCFMSKKIIPVYQIDNINPIFFEDAFEDETLLN